MRVLILLIALTAFAGWTHADGLTGTYKGAWSSANQGSGDLTMIFRPGDSDKPDAEVSFTNEGETIKCAVKYLTITEGSKVELVLNYEMSGNRYETTVLGVLEGKTLSGTYKSKSLADDSVTDSGTWKATAN
jgi:hypothetical protein